MFSPEFRKQCRAAVEKIWNAGGNNDHYQGCDSFFPVCILNFNQSESFKK